MYYIDTMHTISKFLVGNTMKAEQIISIEKLRTEYWPYVQMRDLAAAIY